MQKIFKITSEFDAGTANTILLIEIGPSHFYYGIVRPGDRLLKESGYFLADDNDEHFLDSVFADNVILKSPFNKVVIAYHFPEAILSPLEIYDPAQTEVLMKALYHESPKTSMLPDFIALFNVKNSYCVPVSVQKRMVMEYISANYWHGYSVRLKNVPAKVLDNTHLLLDFRSESFSMILIRDGNLLLVQYLLYKTAADVIYQLLKACQELDIPQESLEVWVAGLIERDSSLFDELYKYFVTIVIEPFSGQLSLDDSFKPYPPHYFSIMDKLLQCV